MIVSIGPTISRLIDAIERVKSINYDQTRDGNKLIIEWKDSPVYKFNGSNTFTGSINEILDHMIESYDHHFKQSQANNPAEQKTNHQSSEKKIPVN